MATPVVNASKAYALAGGTLRESLTDMIFDISPQDTYFISNVSRGTANSVTHEWLVDALAAPAANAFAEGEPFSAMARGLPSRLKNSTQITRRDFAVTGTAQKVNNAGMKELLAYHTARAAKENKRDMEYHNLNNNPHSAGTTTSPRVSAGVANWIYSGNHYKVAAQTTLTTTAPVSGYATATGAAWTASPTVYVSTDLRDMLKLSWSTGGEVDVVLADAIGFNLASNFTGIAQRFSDVRTKQAATITDYADVFVSAYGTVQLRLSRYAMANTWFGLDLSTWEIAFLRPFQVLDSGRDGDQERRTLLSEWTLVAKTPLANCKAHGVAATAG
jgi:hypothetical protein